MATIAHTEIFEDKLLTVDLPTDPPSDGRDPYAYYARARIEKPVEIIPERFGPGSPTFAFIYRHADVVASLQDHEAFSSAAIHEFMSPFMGEYVLVGMDEPKHGRYRDLLSPVLRPKLLNRWEDRLITVVADELIDSFADRGHADLVAEFNFGFPAQVIARIIGVPRENFAQFQHWAMAIVGGTADPEAGIKASQELRAYLAPFIALRREVPEDDLISELLAVELAGDRLSEEEIYSFLMLLLPAGIETTFRSIGNLLFNLLTHPDQLDAVRNDRALVNKAVEESLRIEPPIQYPPRTAARDIEMGGVTIPKGAYVLPLIASANRDPAFIDNPDAFDIHRPQIKHITFGNGVHTCIGLHLAKLETRIALTKLLDRLPGLRLDTERASACDAHIHGKMFRSPTALPVKWDV